MSPSTYLTLFFFLSFSLPIAQLLISCSSLSYSVAVCFTGFGMCGTYSRASRRDRRAAAHQQDAVYTEKPIGTRRHFWQRRQKGNLGTY